MRQKVIDSWWRLDGIEQGKRLCWEFLSCSKSQLSLVLTVPE